MKRNTIPLYALALCVVMTACHGEDNQPSLEVGLIDSKPHAELVAALKQGGHERIAQGTQTLFMEEQGSDKLTPVESPLMLTINKQTNNWTISSLDDDKLGSTLLIGTKLERLADKEARVLPSFDRSAAAKVIEQLARCEATYYPDEANRLAKEGRYTRWFSGEIQSLLPVVLKTARLRRQYAIDSTIVEVTLQGRPTKIVQGELRRAMQERLKELQEQREALLKSGDREGLAKVEALARKYGEIDAADEEEAPIPDNALKPIFGEVWVDAKGRFSVLAIDQHGACLVVAAGEGFDNKSHIAKD